MRSVWVGCGKVWWRWVGSRRVWCGKVFIFQNHSCFVWYGAVELGLVRSGEVCYGD